jgi:23S rRNA (pseudouridine1915-N3)-methyltransferase
MIKINIVAVGKVKEKYFQEGVNEYLKRLNRFCRVNVIEIKERNIVENPNPSEILEILKREGEDIKKELKGHVVAMAIEGKKHSSTSFANFINKIKDEVGEITFVIGGSYGIDSSVKEKASDKISFSDMTFPHTLYRVMLVEQIYRAFTILEDGKYHK